MRLKKNNRAPVWSSPTAGTLGSYYLGDSFSSTMVATDPEGQAVTYATQSGAFPNNLVLNSTSGVLAGDISADDPPVWTSPAAGNLATYNLSASVSHTLTMTPVGAATIQTFRLTSGYLPHGTYLSYTSGTNTATITGTIPNRTYFGLSYVSGYNPAPIWSTGAGSLASLSENFSMSTVTVSATAQAPATLRDYSVVSGSLPVGVWLNSQTGAINGTPQVVTTGLPIDDALPKPTWSSPAAGALETVRVGTAITSQTMTVSAVSPATSISSYVISSGALPPGVILNRSTGVLSGTPSNALNGDTVFSFTVRAIDDRHAFAERSFTLTVQTWDASWASTVLSMRMNGTNGSTTVVDDVGKTVTVNGSAALSNARLKSGVTSLYLEGTTSYLSLADTADWDFSGDFTVECWINALNFTGGPALVSSGAGANDWELYLTAAGVPTFAINNRSTGIANAGASVTANAWRFIAVSRSGSTVRVYIGTTSGGAGTNSASYTAAGLAVGRRQATAANYFAGYLENVRVTKGVARFTGATIVPPLEPPTRA
jgi:hypothetical protein